MACICEIRITFIQTKYLVPHLQSWKQQEQYINSFMSVEHFYDMVELWNEVNETLRFRKQCELDLVKASAEWLNEAWTVEFLNAIQNLYICKETSNSTWNNFYQLCFFNSTFREDTTSFLIRKVEK